MVIVYNIADSDDDKSRPSWGLFWMVKKKLDGSKTNWPPRCQSGLGFCGKPATEGAHVSKKKNVRFVGSGGTIMVYIAPFCHDHNQKDEEYEHTVLDKYLCERGKLGE